MQELKNLLEGEIEINRNKIQKEISLFENKKQNYRNIELNQNIFLILRNVGNEKLMLIGFPFPLESYHLKGFKSKKNTLIFIFLRGISIRNYQRKYFLNEMKDIGKIKYIKVNSSKKFRGVTKSICNKYKKVDYYDPYSFLGDSFIGLHFIENFVKTYGLKLDKIYSENYKNLSVASKSKGYIGEIDKKKNILNIFTDLIDDQWNRTKYLVKSYSKQGLPSIICGRDLIIYPNKNKIYIYHFNREEVILKKENIEDYMNKCLYPFLRPLKNSFNIKQQKSKNIIVNPFGSESSKTIPGKIIFKLSKHVKLYYPNSKILLISGFKNSYHHLLWISELKGFLSKDKLDNVIFKNYGSFDEIKKDIYRYACYFGLTADTSIAHLFNFLGLRNITLFNLNRCDLKSPQSLSSDGPLGFCRYGNVQYPALLENNKEDKLTKGILKAVDYFFGKNEDLDWCDMIFNGKILISQIDSNNIELIEANKKINPRYKLNDQICKSISH